MFGKPRDQKSKRIGHAIVASGEAAEARTCAKEEAGTLTMPAPFGLTGQPL